MVGTGSIVYLRALKASEETQRYSKLAGLTLAILGINQAEGLVLALVAVVIGLAGTWALTSTVRTMLYEVSPLDPAALAGTCAGVLLVTMAACLVPATRVPRVDPTLALRSE